MMVIYRNCAPTRLFALLSAFVIWSSLPSAPVKAQETGVLFNAAQQMVLIEDGRRAIGARANSGGNASWLLESVAGGAGYRIKSTQTGQYLHIENGRLEVGPIKQGWWSAIWSSLPAGTDGSIMLQNYWKKDLHLQVGPQGGVGAFPVRSGSEQFALWKVMPPNQILQGQQSGNATLPANNGAANGNRRNLTIQNLSTAPLDVFVDHPQEPKQVYLLTLQPNEQVTQASPVGYIFRLAQRDQWLNAYRVGQEREQIIKHPSN